MAVKKTKKPAAKKSAAKKPAVKKAPAPKPHVPQQYKGISAVDLVEEMVNKQIRVEQAPKIMMELFVRPSIVAKDKQWEIKSPVSWVHYSERVIDLFEAVNNNHQAAYLNEALKRVYGHVVGQYVGAARSDEPLMRTAAKAAEQAMLKMKEVKERYIVE